MVGKYKNTTIAMWGICAIVVIMQYGYPMHANNMCVDLFYKITKIICSLHYNVEILGTGANTGFLDTVFTIIAANTGNNKY